MINKKPPCKDILRRCFDPDMEGFIRQESTLVTANIPSNGPIFGGELNRGASVSLSGHGTRRRLADALSKRPLFGRVRMARELSPCV